MKHEVAIANDALLMERASNAIVCDLTHSPPGPIALGIVLLSKGLVSETILRPESRLWMLRIRKADVPRDIRLHRYGDRRLEVNLGEIALDAVLAYFLRYYRDREAEVDHLDLEGAWSTGGACDLTVKVGISRTPVSEDEARGRLGL